jgi:Bacterial lipid A biosynthesis acyltransferase
MAAPLRKRIKRSVRSVLIIGAIRLLSLIPLRPALWLGGLVGWIAFVVARRTRRAARASLATAFPERTEPKRAAIARAMFVHLGRAAMEVVAIRWFDEDLASYGRARPAGPAPRGHGPRQGDDPLRSLAGGSGSSRRLPDRRLHYRPGGSHPEASRRVGLDA